MLLHTLLYLIIVVIAIIIGMVVGTLMGVLIFWFLFQLYEMKNGRHRTPSALLRASAALGAIIGMLLMQIPANRLVDWLGLLLPIP